MIGPPEHYRLPWEREKSHPREVWCANDGPCVAEFVSPEVAAYAVAAANAMPGLVEALEQISRNLCFCEGIDSWERPCDPCKARAALAALPKEVRP